MERTVYSKIAPELNIPEEQRIFPDPHHPEKGDELLEKLGGADICFGGIGITGHLAFNEPQPELSPEEFAALPTRVRTIAPETRAVNSIGDLRGALEDMPSLCVTIGMKQILAAKKVRLGMFRDSALLGHSPRCLRRSQRFLPGYAPAASPRCQDVHERACGKRKLKKNRK